MRARHLRRGSRGASLLLALFAVLVCGLVTATVLPSAATSVMRVKDDHDWEQDHLALLSAADAFSAELQRVQYLYEERTTTTVESVYVGEDAEGKPLYELRARVGNPVPQPPVYMKDAAATPTSLALDLCADVVAVAPSLPTSPVPFPDPEGRAAQRTYTIALDSSAGAAADALGTVVAQVKVQGTDVLTQNDDPSDDWRTYNVSAVFYLADDEGNVLENGQRLYLEAAATYEVKTQGPPSVTLALGESKTDWTRREQWTIGDIKISNKDLGEEVE